MNLMEHIQNQLASSNHSPGVTFVAEDGVEETSLEALWERSRRLGQGLKEDFALGPENKVVIIVGPSLDLLSAFLGVMSTGAVPSLFTVPNDRLDPSYYERQVSHLLQVSKATHLVLEDHFVPTLKTLVDNDSELKVLPLSTLRQASQPIRCPAVSAETTALLQHSSGTTGLQKGVMLSHGAILQQVRSLSLALRLEPNRDVIVSWLPLYHDMGLLGAFLLPALTGTRLVFLSPFEWVQKPQTFLKAISDHRGTISFLPNFSYNFMANPQRLTEESLEGLDLSSVRALINCSEPIRKASHEAFLSRFAPYGLRASALAGSYALAENTFAATVGGISEPLREEWVDEAALRDHRVERVGEEQGRALVSSGTPIHGTEIRIVNEVGDEVGPDCMGQILLRSPYMLNGYHLRPDLDQTHLKAGWYWTGDMGYQSRGHLFIVGRKKDLMIVGGKNIYPEDVEAALGSVDGLHPGRTVVFGVENEEAGTEDIVVVAEVQPTVDRGAIKKAVKQIVTQETGFGVSAIQLVEDKWLIKTSSGKISRDASRRKYLESQQNQTPQVRYAAGR